jgi:hypothetical protein
MRQAVQHKRFAFALILVLATAAFAAPAPAPGTGAQGMALGAFLGQPTGLSFRYGLAGSSSLEAKAAWDLVAGAKGQGSTLILQGNWLMEFPGILVIDGNDFPLYFGVGAQADIGSGFAFGARVPGGIAYRFAKVPVELNLEAALGLQLLPSTTLTGGGGLGIRYRF